MALLVPVVFALVELAFDEWPGVVGLAGSRCGRLLRGVPQVCGGVCKIMLGI